MSEGMEMEFEESAFDSLVEDDYAVAQTCQLPTAA